MKTKLQEVIEIYKQKAEEQNLPIRFFRGDMKITQPNGEFTVYLREPRVDHFSYLQLGCSTETSLNEPYRSFFLSFVDDLAEKYEVDFIWLLRVGPIDLSPEGYQVIEMNYWSSWVKQVSTTPIPFFECVNVLSHLKTKRKEDHPLLTLVPEFKRNHSFDGDLSSFAINYALSGESGEWEVTYKDGIWNLSHLSRFDPSLDDDEMFLDSDCSFHSLEELETHLDEQVTKIHNRTRLTTLFKRDPRWFRFCLYKHTYNCSDDVANDIHNVLLQKHSFEDIEFHCERMFRGNIFESIETKIKKQEIVLFSMMDTIFVTNNTESRSFSLHERNEAVSAFEEMVARAALTKQVSRELQAFKEKPA